MQEQTTVGTCRVVSVSYAFQGSLILLQETKLAVERSEVIVSLHDGHQPRIPCCCAVEHTVIISVIVTNRALRRYNAGRAS